MANQRKGQSRDGTCTKNTVNATHVRKARLRNPGPDSHSSAHFIRNWFKSGKCLYPVERLCIEAFEF